MQRRCNLAYFILASVIVLVLTPLMVCVDAQAQIAFSSERDGNYEIYVMDNDGNNQQNLTNNPNNDGVPAWSPDGKRIAFISDRDGNVIDNIPGLPIFEIYVMDNDGDNQQNLTNDPNNDAFPAWSPDGKRIAFISDRDGNAEIYVMDNDGNNQQNLTNNPDNDFYPSWSPDGKRIVFASDRDGHFIGEFGITSEIYLMDADGGNQQRFTENRNNDESPSYSPDGKWIAFMADRKGNYEIYVMDADGGNQRRLTENRGDDVSPSWSPDGKRIAFSSERDRHPDVMQGWFTSEIYVMDADGGNQQNLTNNPHGDANPAWFNSPFSVSPAGKKFTMWGWLKQVNR